jgi:hypothetical protein
VNEAATIQASKNVQWLILLLVFFVAGFFWSEVWAAGQQIETEIVQYEVVRIACVLPDGCDITLQQEGNRRPLNLRCRDGCVLMAQDTVIAQTTLTPMKFNAEPER